MPSPILLISTDPVAGTSLVDSLTGLGHSVTVVDDPASAVGSIADHGLVVFDVAPGDTSAVDACREIRAEPSLATIPIMCVAGGDDVEERIAYLEAGADDVITRPFDARELEARLEALQLRFQRTRDRAAPMAGHGAIAATVRSVAVFSPKGGVGTTTVATNIAVAAAQRRPDRVVIADLALPFGSVTTHLNVAATQTLADVVRHESALQEPEHFRTYATKHSSGLHVLAAPGSPELADLIEVRHIDPLISAALGTYDSIVVDAGSTLDERTMAILARADSIVVPLYPEIAALKAIHAMLDFLMEAGSIPAKMVFVLNNCFAREILRRRDIESALATRITLDLPYDPFLYLKAVNEGIPVVLGAARSEAAERLVKLSTMVFGEDGAAAPEGVGAKKGLLGGLLKR